MGEFNQTLNGSGYVQMFHSQLPDHVWPLWDTLTWDTLRTFFYMVPPSESTYENTDDVPEWEFQGLTWFFTLGIIETLFIKTFKHEEPFKFNDMITSVLSGQATMLYTLFHKGFNIWFYAYVYEHYRIMDLPWNATWVWVLCFFTQDFMAYWSHRAMHEVGFFWAFHQTHHSSQYYNIWVSTRLSIFQPMVATMFEAVNAFIIPPGIHLVHSHLSLLFQFWLHTKYIPSLGPIEWFLNTPYLHRVHHARNPYCIDKNYGVVLIIWDRIFGTFGREKEDEPAVYGLVNNVYTFDMAYVQFSYFKHVFWDKPWCLLPKGTSLKDRLLSFVYPIGWQPGKKLTWLVWWRMEDPTEDVPEVENPVYFYDPVLPRWLYIYVQFNNAIQTYLYTKVLVNFHTLSAGMTAIYYAYMLIGIQSTGYMLDGRWWVGRVELVRTMIFTLVFFAIGEPSLLVMMLSGFAITWSMLFLRYGPKYRIELVNKPHAD